jgi:hypothetical protein
MARAAGLKKEAAGIIASAAQFVDDNADKESIEFKDGARLDSEASAHHAVDKKNIDPEDQRKIWVPFHFLPGNEGDSFTERLICRKNSQIAREMLRFILSESDRPYAMQLVGIAAHVYADTFSHYGFSGVSSRRNKVDNDSFEFYGLGKEMQQYIKNKQTQFEKKYHKETGFLTNIKSWLAETFSGALGHGAVVTFPDRPYLKWSFEYEDPKQKSGIRDNNGTFMEGCEALHGFFREFAALRKDQSENDFAEFKNIQDPVEAIINLQAAKQDRIEAWKQAAAEGEIFATGPESIPDYDLNSWDKQRENLAQTKNSEATIDQDIYKFFQAASVFRQYVLRILLPPKGLVVT